MSETASTVPSVSSARRLAARDLAVHIRQRAGLQATLRRQPPPVVKAVDGVTLELNAGEFVALVGESGSGKTTTAQALLGELAATGGSVSYGGAELARLDAAAQRRYRREVQMIFQDPYESLSPRQSVGAAVAEGLAIHGIGTRAERRRLVLDALTAVGLSPATDYVGRYPHQLSGGQRQRVAIACCCALSPRFLLADEPVSMLDLSIRREILAVFDELRRGRAMGILMITHDLGTALGVADRVVVMKDGRVVEQGTVAQIRDRPVHPYTVSLLQALPTDIDSSLARAAAADDEPEHQWETESAPA